MTLANIQIKKILYATDLSESARHAFSYAVSLANMYGAGSGSGPSSPQAAVLSACSSQ